MRLIDADALMDDIRQNSASYFADDFAHEWVDKQPTITPDMAQVLAYECGKDSVERKRGEWIKNDGRYGWHCSECKVDNFYAYLWNSEAEQFDLQDRYCPHCGAEMRKGEEDERESKAHD